VKTIRTAELKDTEQLLRNIVQASGETNESMAQYVEVQYGVDREELAEYAMEWGTEVTRTELHDQLRMKMVMLLTGQADDTPMDLSIIQTMYTIGALCYLHGVTMGLELHRRYCE